MIANLIGRRQGLAALAAICLLLAFGGAARAETRPYSIFFDYEHFDATPVATRLIAQIKGLIKKKSRVTITGHCDTAEPDISLARAAHVHGILIGLGVSYDVEFIVVGKGADELRVKTGPGVHEPQNRRVEVKIE